MILMGLVLLACAPPADDAPASPVAGCAVVETRYGYWDNGETPWRVEARSYDDRGRPIARDLQVAPGDENETHTIESWEYDDDDHVVVERRQIIEVTHGVTPPVNVQEHTWDGALRVHTETWNAHSDGSTSFTGLWDYRYDGEGHLLEALWDGNDDAEPDLFIEEQWTHDLLGWQVDRTERFTADGEVIATEHRELDDHERLIRGVEDWDADGSPERVQRFELDEQGRTIGWELGGTAMLGMACDYTWRGDDQVESSCTDEVREGVFVTTWRFPQPGRADVAQVRQHLEGGAADTEVWSFEWDCP
jgi:hypothetical protein